LALYERAARRAEEAGLILADTKFELGYVDGVITLCDELLTPDGGRTRRASELRPRVRSRGRPPRRGT
ncbi:MAG: hypothetical protein M1134_01095, partial [Actinobacteria bacterium]|nr:hypothetical protein [Actinomycetota bacterium]